MQSNFNKFSILVVISILIKSSFETKLNLKKLDDLKIDDKEIGSMLNDPKFSNIASDLNKLKSSRAEMERAGKELKAMGVDLNNKDKSSYLTSKGLGDLNLDNFLKTELEKPKKPAIGIIGNASSPDDILAKLGDFKDLGLELGSTTTKIDSVLDDSRISAGQEVSKNNLSKKDFEKNKNPIDEPFKNLEFLTKQQARLLLEILKQPVFFGMLPQEAQRIVKVKLQKN